MPEGIIKDPQQNPVEKRYGVLYTEDNKTYYAYDKVDKNNPKRNWTFGLEIEFENTVKLPDGDQFDFNGQTIDKKVSDDVHLKPYNSTTKSAKDPVYRLLYEGSLGHQINKTLLKEAKSRNGGEMQSELEPDFDVEKTK